MLQTKFKKKIFPSLFKLNYSFASLCKIWIQTKFSLAQKINMNLGLITIEHLLVCITAHQGVLIAFIYKIASCQTYLTSKWVKLTAKHKNLFK